MTAMPETAEWSFVKEKDCTKKKGLSYPNDVQRYQAWKDEIAKDKNPEQAGIDLGWESKATVKKYGNEARELRIGGKNQARVMVAWNAGNKKIYSSCYQGHISTSYTDILESLANYAGLKARVGDYGDYQSAHYSHISDDIGGYNGYNDYNGYIDFNQNNNHNIDSALILSTSVILGIIALCVTAMLSFVCGAFSVYFISGYKYKSQSKPQYEQINQQINQV